MVIVQYEGVKARRGLTKKSNCPIIEIPFNPIKTESDEL